MKRQIPLILIWPFLVFSSLLFAETNTNLRDAYVLRANDTVKLSVYEELDLASEVTILKTGQAAFPLIGTLEIAGLTLTEATEEIRKQYAADYIRHPKVTLTVTEYATEYVSVIGQVSNPGKVPLPQIGNLDLGSALLTAGGITDTADPKNIQLITAKGETKTLTHEAIQGEAGHIVMKSGDKLVIHESPFARSVVSVIGEVKNPGNYAIPKSGKMDLASALATAGGLSALADTNAITIISSDGRRSSYSHQSIQHGSAGKTPVNGGDRVVVSKSPFSNTTVTILGQVKNSGAIAFPLNGRLDLMTAIAMAGGFTELANLKKVIVTRAGTQTILDVRDSAQKGRGGFMLKPNDIIKVEERWF
ncbi:SLBB domain-containing protein [Akkermansiaceae bacterium]|nr:SLBB domain-containing protein [Akkermansiaceae bacterium]